LQTDAGIYGIRSFVPLLGQGLARCHARLNNPMLIFAEGTVEYYYDL